MKIEINKIPGNYDGKECFVHARACALDNDNFIMTMQTLNVFGDDLFSTLYVCRSSDGGRTWTEPKQDSAFTTTFSDNGIRTLGCDATHLLHKKTGVPMLAGHTVSYSADGLKPVKADKDYTFYAVYDLKNNKYNTMKLIEVPDDIYPIGCGTGCSQMVEDDNGDILLPVYIRDGSQYYKSAVMRCDFDGETITYKSMSNHLSFNIDRGLCEPSICRFNGKYYLTLRNDRYGLFSVSEDGNNFSEPELWRWDNGLDLPTYNTQSHWLICGGKLHLVYTRKAGSNDHVFRHRAPLFMAEVDTESMRILRHTEQIVAPERGARLGNFGVTHVNDNLSLVTVTEWMQPRGCEKYGSDNSIFVTRVEA